MQTKCHLWTYKDTAALSEHRFLTVGIDFRWRGIALLAAALGPLACLAAALGPLDSLATAALPPNLINLT